MHISQEQKYGIKKCLIVVTNIVPHKDLQAFWRGVNTPWMSLLPGRKISVHVLKVCLKIKNSYCISKLASTMPLFDGQIKYIECLASESVPIMV